VPEALLTLASLGVLAVAYAVRARTLARRGAPVGRMRPALFAAGLGVLAVALASPFADLAEGDLFVAHMAQHVLLLDVAAPLLLLGLTGSLLRPVLAALPTALVRPVTHPWIALPAALALFVGWHVPVLFDAAVRHEPVHVLEHASFLAAGILVWLPLLETLPAPAWFGAGAKLGFLVAWRLGQTVLGNVLLWAPAPLYAVYASPAADRLDPLTDQRLAAALMMAEGTIVFLALAAWLGVRALTDAERRQSLLDRGSDPRTAARAVRYGR
jgi:cytochrome c oxidase assembly factor CtaG